MLKKFKLFILILALTSLGAACSPDDGNFPSPAADDAQNEASPSDVTPLIPDEHAQAPNASDAVVVAPAPVEDEVASGEGDAELSAEEAAARAAAESAESADEADEDDVAGDSEVVPGSSSIAQRVIRKKNPQDAMSRVRLNTNISAAQAWQCLPVQFEDENLKAAVARTLGTNKVTRCNCDIETLYADDLGISSLEGIQYCANLKTLHLWGNSIEHLEPLSHLNTLQELYLFDNRIVDLAPLNNMPSLKRLDLRNNKINDLFSLYVLVNQDDSQLEVVDIVGNESWLFPQIPECSFDAATCAERNRAYISSVREADPRLNDRNRFYLKSIKIAKPELVLRYTIPLIHFENQNLKAAVEQALSIKDVRQNNCNITILDASSKGIDSLEGLQFCRNLKILNLFDNRINDLAPLRGLTKLQELGLARNQISDIAPLRGLTSLTYLGLEGNLISKISALSGLTKLERLNLSSNQISNISALSGLTKLEQLNLSGNQISNISALSGLTKLGALQILNNTITELVPLVELSLVGELYYVDLSGNRTTLFPENDEARHHRNLQSISHLNGWVQLLY